MLNIYSPRIPIKKRINDPIKKIPMIIEAVPAGYVFQFNNLCTNTNRVNDKLITPIKTEINIATRINNFVDEVIPCIATDRKSVV